ncbi:MAG TPA: hypothetical protein VN693_07105 [Rhodanobacteraceae bacterium]|nr:hypothetical protein [Rhodanobacteraceae bacterium]
MSSEMIALKHLIVDLDDTRILYQASLHRFRQAEPNQLVRRIAQAHALIAENLADRIYASGGGETMRTGKRWRNLRAGWADLHARFALAPELDRLRFVRRSETRVLRRFEEAIQDNDVYIKCRLQLHRRDLEGTWEEVNHLIHAMSNAAPAHA